MFKIKDTVKAVRLLGLTKEEQNILIKTVRDGSKKESKNAEEMLLARSKPVIEAVAVKYQHKLAFDELVKLGEKGFKKALRLFKPSKKFQFMVYATWFIRAEIHEKLSLPLSLPGE